MNITNNIYYRKLTVCIIEGAVLDHWNGSDQQRFPGFR
jgi:hypothetical protein